MSEKVITDYVFSFSKNNKPVEKVEVGETVEFITLDCFSNQVTSEDQLITTIDMNQVNPATGPVYVQGAEVGDVLVVEILDIQVADTATGTTIPDTGPLSDTSESRTRRVEIKDGMAQFNNIEFPIDPMVGVIGVAPKGEDVPCGMWGDHGGNIDNKKIVKGTTAYFPVNVEGALFQLGDLHANMGDGEISGAGLEIPGRVKVKLDIIKDFKINRPVHRNDEKWYTMSNARTYEEALILAAKDMQKLIVDAYGWDETDAYIYMSAQGDIEICQGAFPADGWDMTVRFGIPIQKDMPLIG